MKTLMSRRRLLGAMASAGALALTGGRAFSQSSGSLVAATYPGSWEEAHRQILMPAFQQATGADLSLAPVQGLDQVAQIVAARGNPPYDVALLPTGPMLQALPQDVLLPFPVERSRNVGNVPEAFRREAGPDVALQVVGIAYNPERVEAPTSWEALWDENTAGRVGICAMTSGLGTAFMMEVARLRGGDPYELEPAFEAVAELMPSVASVANNPSTLGALFQQGEVDIAPQFLNEVETLRASGVPIAFARPDTGWSLLASGMYITRGAADPELALAYIDTALDVDVQRRMSEAPYFLVPTNRDVPLSGALANLASSMDELASSSNQYDWEIVNARRPDWIERFNRTVRG